MREDAKAFDDDEVNRQDGGCGMAVVSGGSVAVEATVDRAARDLKGLEKRRARAPPFCLLGSALAVLSDGVSVRVASSWSEQRPVGD